MPPSGASTNATAWTTKSPLPFSSPKSTFVLPIGAVAGVSVLVVSVFLLISSLNVYVAETVGTGCHSDPNEKAMFVAISVVPLAEQLIPAAAIAQLNVNINVSDRRRAGSRQAGSSHAGRQVVAAS